MKRMSWLIFKSRFENNLNRFKYYWNSYAPYCLIWPSSISAHLEVVSEIQRILYVEMAKHHPISDYEKEKWSRASGHVAPDRDEHIRYYNCWHCKHCNEHLERRCVRCKLIWEEHTLEQYFDCIGHDCVIDQVCPKGCVDVGGWAEFLYKPSVEKSNA